LLAYGVGTSVVFALPQFAARVGASFAGTAQTFPAYQKSIYGVPPVAASLINFAAEAAGAINPADLSIMTLVTHADPVVKGVLIILVFFSFWCWTVMFDKFIAMAKANGAIGRLEDKIETGTLEDIINYEDEKKHPLALVVEAGNSEWREGSGEHAHEALHEVRDRIEHAMRLELSNEIRRLNKGLPFLATVGSAAPFIGLFGTVWGIMNTFTSIGANRDTSLATVAPGIAEALIATGIGLAAAIPAIMAYNKLSTDMGRYSGRVGTVVGIYAGRLAKRFAPAGKS
jgi:biopolymer transport protein TolQ